MRHGYITPPPPHGQLSLVHTSPSVQYAVTSHGPFPSSIPCGPRLGPSWAKLGPKWAPDAPDRGPFGNAAWINVSVPLRKTIPSQPSPPTHTHTHQHPPPLQPYPSVVRPMPLVFLIPSPATPQSGNSCLNRATAPDLFTPSRAAATDDQIWPPLPQPENTHRQVWVASGRPLWQQHQYIVHCGPTPITHLDGPTTHCL